jgi:hypothetical protein
MSTPDRDQSPRRLQAVFRDIALAIGGVFYAYPVPDEAVWETARSLDKIFQQALAKRKRQSKPEPPIPRHSRGRKHPAIVELLRRLDTSQEMQPRADMHA